jgi:hypothetical protein
MTRTDIPKVDYSSENPGKILDSYSLIEAIHELLDPTSEHNSDYLIKRINLLREIFDIGEYSSNINSRTIDQLISGYGQIKPLNILPFENALEVPDSIDTEAHAIIEKQFNSDLGYIRKKVYEIQRAYITYIIIHSIDGKFRSKTVKLSELISAGLPKSDLGSYLN